MKHLFSWPFLWPFLVVVSAGAADALVRINTGSPAQVVLVLWFLLICPGMLVVRFLQLEEPLVEWMLAVVLSLAIDTFVAGALLIARAWSPQAAFLIIVVITALGAVIDAARKSATVRGWVARLVAGASRLIDRLIDRLSSRRRADRESAHEVGV